MNNEQVPIYMGWDRGGGSGGEWASSHNKQAPIYIGVGVVVVVVVVAIKLVNEQLNLVEPDMKHFLLSDMNHIWHEVSTHTRLQTTGVM